MIYLLGGKESFLFCTACSTELALTVPCLIVTARLFHVTIAKANQRPWGRDAFQRRPPASDAQHGG